VLSPYLAWDKHFDLFDTYLNPLLRHLQQANPDKLDDDRIFISGLSEGGEGAMHAGLRYPDIYAGVAAAAAESGPHGVYEPVDLTAKPIKLRFMVVSAGSKDWCEPHPEIIADLMDRTLLSKRVALHYRVYVNADHGMSWQYLLNQWADVHKIMWQGEGLLYRHNESTVSNVSYADIVKDRGTIPPTTTAIIDDNDNDKRLHERSEWPYIVFGVIALALMCFFLISCGRKKRKGDNRGSGTWVTPYQDQDTAVELSTPANAS